jgi:hypothetical protein
VPFAINETGGVTSVALPVQELNDPKARTAFGTIIKLCQLAGFNIELCKDNNIAVYEATLAALEDNVWGAFLCLNRDVISVQSGVPAKYKPGWDFALWYCVNTKLKEAKPNQFLKLERQTSITSASQVGNAWRQNNSFTVLNQLESLIRAACKVFTGKLASPKGFIRSENFFLEKFVGKKPQKGLYTDEEYTDVCEYHDARVAMIKAVYANFPDQWSNFHRDGLSAQLSLFNVRVDARIKNIEDAKSSRIPYLLVKRRQKGVKGPVDVISKGGSLADKLRDCGGGESVRTVAKVMWSPLTGIPQSEFVPKAIIAGYETVNATLHSVWTYIDSQYPSIRDGADVKPRLALRNSLYSCAQLYSDIYEDKRGIPSWDSAFGRG